MTKDYYRILGVLDDADEIVIRAAYKALAQRYHPDKWTGSKEEANKRMSEINEAYGVLSDPVKRKQYDATRKNQFGNTNSVFVKQESFKKRLLFFFVWIASGYVLSYLVNEFVFLLLNNPPIGVNTLTALLPALGSSLILFFFGTKAIQAISNKDLQKKSFDWNKFSKIFKIILFVYVLLVVLVKIYFLVQVENKNLSSVVSSSKEKTTKLNEQNISNEEIKCPIENLNYLKSKHSHYLFVGTRNNENSALLLCTKVRRLEANATIFKYDNEVYVVIAWDGWGSTDMKKLIALSEKLEKNGISNVLRQFDK